MGTWQQTVNTQHATLAAQVVVAYWSGRRCWGEGEDTTLRSSLRLSRYANGSRRTGSTLRLVHYETKAYDDVAPLDQLTRESECQQALRPCL
jgi:hypothetical protein